MSLMCTQTPTYEDSWVLDFRADYNKKSRGGGQGDKL